MTSIAAGLAQALPKPKYTGEDEELPSRAQQKGPRVVGRGELDETQIVLKVRELLFFFSLSLLYFFLFRSLFWENKKKRACY